MHSFRAATWNLDGYRRDAPSRLARQIQKLESLNLDVLVLTEVMDTTHLVGQEFWWSAEGKPPYKRCDRAVGVASHCAGEQLSVSDSRLSVCVVLDGRQPLGRVIVYGTIIPYALDGVRQGLAKPWERHRKAVTNVVADVRRLRSDPVLRGARLVLAGDFNMGLDGTRWYGDPAARAELVEGLAEAGLRCHTLEDIRATRGSDRAIVDHLWASFDLAPVDSLHVWCDRAESNRLSDHNGVALRLAPVT